MNFFYFLLLFFINSCTKPILSPIQKYNKALEYYKNKEYGEAAYFFRETIISLAGREEELKSRYYLANCYFEKGDFIKSAESFGDFFNLYFNHEKAEESLYMQILSYYNNSDYSNLDQTFTYSCLEAIEIYLENFPEGNHQDLVKDYKKSLTEKLEKKSFDHMKVFFDLEYYRSAVFYAEILEKSCNKDMLEKILEIKIESLSKLIEGKKDRKNLQVQKWISILYKTYFKFCEKFPKSTFLDRLRSSPIYVYIEG